MTERPIIFSAPMVRALLDGTKTQTRRVIKGVKLFSPEYDRQWRPHVIPPGGAIPDKWSWWEGPSHGPSLYHTAKIPFAVGDRLWVRESWRTESDAYNDLKPSEMSGEEKVLFEADGDWSQNKTTGRRHAAMHMPRWASRLTLVVTDVRVERLQAISKADVMAEGVRERDGHPLEGCHAGWHEPFATLWNSINGPGAWEANPWVIAITFTVERAT